MVELVSSLGGDYICYIAPLVSALQVLLSAYTHHRYNYNGNGLCVLRFSCLCAVYRLCVLYNCIV